METTNFIFCWLTWKHTQTHLIDSKHTRYLCWHIIADGIFGYELICGNISYTSRISMGFVADCYRKRETRMKWDKQKCSDCVAWHWCHVVNNKGYSVHWMNYYLWRKWNRKDPSAHIHIGCVCFPFHFFLVVCRTGTEFDSQLYFRSGYLCT